MNTSREKHIIQQADNNIPRAENNSKYEGKYICIHFPVVEWGSAQPQ